MVSCIKLKLEARWIVKACPQFHSCCASKKTCSGQRLHTLEVIDTIQHMVQVMELNNVKPLAGGKREEWFSIACLGLKHKAMQKLR
jgi:hypothetical protein